LIDPVTFSSSFHSHRAFASPKAGVDYFATELHYRSLAGRIIVALGGFNVVIVTGDPPANAPLVTAALSEAARLRHTVIRFPCGAELRRSNVPHFSRALSASLASVNTTELTPEFPVPTQTLVVFEDTDQLSDGQIEEIFKNLYPFTKFGDRRIAAAVLLANPDFLDRLEKPLLRFWLAKRLLVARLRFEELGADEIPAFIRHQLGSSEAEDALTPEAMDAIANVSGGDPMLVNRFSRRLLDFEATARGDTTVRPVVSPRTLVPAEMPLADRSIDILGLSTRATRGRSAVLKLSAATVSCVVCVSLAAVLLVSPAYQTNIVTSLNSDAVPSPEGEVSLGEREPSRARVTASGAVISNLSREKSAKYSAYFTQEAGVAGGMQEKPDSTGTMPIGGLAFGWAEPSGTTAVANTGSTFGSTPGEPAGAPIESTPTAGPDRASRMREEVLRPATTASLDVTATRGSAGPPVGMSMSAVRSTSVETATSTVPITPMTSPGPSPLEIVALVARGDSMFGLRDIASARLFYERAAEAGNEDAALKLANTFGPGSLHFSDPNMAAYWYRRARDLAKSEAR
jgi:hypothetical protein